MIVSHKHKFIFIKTTKTAGTSMEIALSKFCGPDDIITKISPEDEVVRQELGFRGAQNYVIPFSRYAGRDYVELVRRGKRLIFHNHSSANYITRYLDASIWNSYYKFCFERNPWDKVISLYFWQHKAEPRPTIEQFVESLGSKSFGSADIYMMGDKIAVDKMFQYEQLDQALEAIRDHIGLDETPVMPRTKVKYRVDKRHYRDVLTARQRDMIAKACSREVASFNYCW